MDGFLLGNENRVGMHRDVPVGIFFESEDGREIGALCVLENGWTVIPAFTTRARGPIVRVAHKKDDYIVIQRAVVAAGGAHMGEGVGRLVFDAGAIYDL